MAETDFKQQLADYKQRIDTDIAEYIDSIGAEYGEHAYAAVDAYAKILGSGGKRIRGALTMVGYEAMGGTDQAMILQAARAIEMIHAYLLVIDDMQDKSVLRHGMPAAHKQLETYHDAQAFLGDREHFGQSLATNGALVGLHEAESLLAQLDVEAERRLKVLKMINDTLVKTVHGQSLDIINEQSPKVAIEDIEQVMELKTALYTILNPLQVGMALAGANDEALQSVSNYAAHTGKAFQISDDILSTFGDENVIHKNPMDDMREGKQTLLVFYALEHADEVSKRQLQSALGNDHLTAEEFAIVKTVIEQSGALAYARARAQEHIQEATKAVETLDAFSDESGAFLNGLVMFLADRAY